ncbi:MAG TPA: hypothetical protein VKU61_00975 [Candidatus Binatia bacterium]|nr:hypothetical protein [Candidatus Binatia bacterium]
MLGTVDQHALLEVSALVEQAFAVLALVLLAALWLASRHRPRVAPAVDQPGTPVTGTEAALLLVVLAGAVVLRTAWWDRGLPGTIFGGEIGTARAALAVQRGGLLGRWWSLVRQLNGGGWWYDSPVVEPVIVAFQSVFPPQVHGIVRVGAAFGTAGVLLAWLVGRLLHGPRFGLAFAAFVAVSPLQVVWSRLGYRAMAVAPHVLLTLALAAVAARRRSIVLAGVVGVVAYATVYNHEVARAAMPLAIVAIWCASRTLVRRNLWFVTLSLGVALVIVTLAERLPETGGMSDMLWPTYHGAAGNQGERTLREFVEKNYARVKTETSRSLADYFLINRDTPPAPAAWGWGIAHGGLTFLPVTALGVLGLIRTLRAPAQYLVWFAMLVVGLALPAMACTVARRLLVFDLGWCAFAAAGMLALADTAVLGRVPRRARGILAGALVAAIGCWTMAAIVGLAPPLDDGPPAPVAYGSGWFACPDFSRLSDVTTCRRCLEVAKGWEADIRDEKLIILVDSDMNRETPTSPGGLPLYGFLAAARNGTPERFQELYPILLNVNHVPESHAYYARPGDYAAYVADLLHRAPHRSIVWHAERPTAWDRWLARRLGGTTATFATPLSAVGGFRVETPASADDSVIELLTSLETRSACVKANVVAEDRLPFQANTLAVAEIVTTSAPAAWFALSWNEAWSPDGVWHLPGIRNLVGRDGEVGTLRSDGWGERFAWPARALVRTDRLTELLPVGRGCATFAGSDWWVVDPERGMLHSRASHDWLPPGDWIGLASDRRAELILAGADQRLVVADVAAGAVRADFPAIVTPSRVEEFGECTQIVRGRDWIGVYRAPANAVDFYALDGRRIGTLDLGAHGFAFVRAVGAVDDFLAVSDASQKLTTVRVDLTACAASEAAP